MSAEAKDTGFTPGPWQIVIADETPMNCWAVANCGGPSDPDAKGDYVLVVAPITDYCCSAESDARLIAAAPPMHAALEMLNRNARPVNWDDDEESAAAWRALDAALASARGEA